jgi:hypothetical protein
MIILFYLGILALIMYWCYTIARRNKRSTTLALFMGFFFGLWAVIVYYIIGKSQTILKEEIKEELNKK